jgi:NADH-quinone oxidoreductase subunit C
VRPDVNAVQRTLETAGLEADVESSGLGVLCRIAPGRVAGALGALHGDGYEFLVDLFANDTVEGLELTYHLRSFAADTELFVRCRVPYDGEVPSVWRSHPAALYPEREAAELFGVDFRGHPNPKRLLTSDEVGTYLMRKNVPVRTHEEVMRDE